MSTEAVPRARSRAQIIAWASRQKDANLSEVQASSLTAVYPNWRRTNDDVWFANLESVEAFLAQHGRLPASSGKIPGEAIAGRWLVALRTRKRLSPIRAQALADRLPQALMSRDDVWMEKLSAAVVFYATHGRLAASNTEDEDEKKLAAWLHGIRFFPQSAERLLALDTQLPAWRHTPDDIWAARVEQVAVFASENGRYPAANAKDDQERKLAAWLRSQPTKKIPLTALQLATLNERLPGWNRTNDDVWNDNLEAVRAFLIEHKRFPIRSTSKPAAECGAARWLYDQRRKKITPSREALLNERIPGWREATPGMAVVDSAHMV